MGLLDLSGELLIAILSELHPSSSPALSLTSRRLHQLSSPKLYQSIYYCGSGNLDRDGTVFADQVCFGHKLPLDASRIYDLKVLMTTLQQSLTLSSQVRRVELFWGADEGVDGDIRILDFLDVTKHMRFERLTLSPPHLHFRIPQHAAITVLKLRHHGPSGGCDRALALDIDQLHRQSCIQSVNEVSIDGWLYWSESVLEASPLNTMVDVPLERAKTSPITTLRVSTCGAPGYVFNEILSWPRSLKTFHFECVPRDQYQMPGRVCSADFIQPLQHCRESLEELSIRCSIGVNDRHVNTSRPINLREFPSLKRLCIRSDFLITDKSLPMYQEPQTQDKQKVPSKLFEVLPPSLEQLHLEIGDEQWSMYTDDSNIVSDEVLWFLDRLEELALRKADHLPRLKTLICGECPGFYFQHISTIIDGFARGAELKAAFARENIQLSYWTSDDEFPAFDNH